MIEHFKALGVPDRVGGGRRLAGFLAQNLQRDSSRACVRLLCTRDSTLPAHVAAGGVAAVYRYRRGLGGEEATRRPSGRGRRISRC